MSASSMQAECCDSPPPYQFCKNISRKNSKLSSSNDSLRLCSKWWTIKMENQNCRAGRFAPSLFLKICVLLPQYKLGETVRFFFEWKCAHGNRFVTSEPKLLYLISPGVKFMNHFTDLKNPLLKSFWTYKLEWENGDFCHFYLQKQMSKICHLVNSYLKYYI